MGNMKREIRLIVPAAGAGTRLGAAVTKTLHRVAGKPILGHILDSIEDLVDEGIIVARPSAENDIKTYLRSRSSDKVRTTLQLNPIGIADAVELGLLAFDGSNACDYLIIWGDHVTVRRSTVRETINHHRRTGAWLTFPTSIRTSPYTHLVRNAEGGVETILESREGDPMPTTGENDCGVFVTRGEFLAQGLRDLRELLHDPLINNFRRLDGSASVRGEFSFLPLVALWARKGRHIEAISIAAYEETIGVNDADEASIAEKILANT